MSEHSIRSGGEIAKAITKSLGEFFKKVIDILNELRGLPNLISSFRQDVNDGVNNLIQAQGEMQIHMKMSNIASKKALLDSEGEAIEEFEQQLRQDFDVINRRFQKVSDELDEDSRKRIMEIDQHLLNIPRQFPHEIYEVIQTTILPSVDHLTKDAELTSSQRLEVLYSVAEKAEATLNSFLDTRTSFYKRVSSFLVPDETSVDKTYYIPVWLSASSMKSKANRNDLILPSNVKFHPGSSSGTLGAIDFQADEHFERFDSWLKKESVAKIALSKTNWKKRTIKERAKLKEDLVAYARHKNQRSFSFMKSRVNQIIDRSNLSNIAS